MRLLPIIFLLLNYIQGLSCDCYDRLNKPFQSEDYEEVDLIYLVEIGQEIDSGVFEVKLIESFKGDFNSKTKIENWGPCSYNVRTGERWLIYTNRGPTDLTSIYGCSRSRDIDKRKYWIPPPPPPLDQEETNKKKYSIIYQKYLNSDRGDINKELEQLREIKTNAR